MQNYFHFFSETLMPYIKGKMDIDVSGLTDKGLRRDKNEDFFHIDKDIGLFVVADGIGGHRSGEVASKMAVEGLCDYIDNIDNRLYSTEAQKKYSETTNKISTAIMFANDIVYRSSLNKPDLKGMGTTLTVGLLQNERLSIAHVGDSRLYLIRANCMEQLTDDHTIVHEQLKSGLITKDEAAKSKMKSVLTRAVGTSPEVKVSMDELAVSNGDIILLCTDGLTSMLSDDEIYSTIITGREPQSTCSRLVEMAIKNGGNDNITVILIYLYKKSIFSFLYKLLNKIRR